MKPVLLLVLPLVALACNNAPVPTPAAADSSNLQPGECLVTWKPDSDMCKTGTCTTVFRSASPGDVLKQCETANGVGNAQGALSCGPCL